MEVSACFCWLSFPKPLASLQSENLSKTPFCFRQGKGEGKSYPSEIHSQVLHNKSLSCRENYYTGALCGWRKCHRPTPAHTVWRGRRKDYEGHSPGTEAHWKLRYYQFEKVTHCLISTIWHSRKGTTIETITRFVVTRSLGWGVNRGGTVYFQGSTTILCWWVHDMMHLWKDWSLM